MNVNGTNVRTLTSSPKFDGGGELSPNGRKILFYSQRLPYGDVWVMNADGSGQRNLSRNAAHDSGGSWSPDGRRIAFDTNRDGNGEIYVMNADGSGQRISRRARRRRRTARSGLRMDGRSRSAPIATATRSSTP